MDKVHILKWAATGHIGGVYSDYEKACKIAEKANKNVSTWQRILAAISHEAARWIVQTFDVED